MAKTKPVKAAKPAKDDGNATACAVLSYLLVGIIWYFVDENMKKSQFARFHAKQGLALLISEIALAIALAIVSTVFAFTMVLWPLALLLEWVVRLAILVLVVLGIINAANGAQKKLPIIGDFAEKLNI